MDKYASRYIIPNTFWRVPATDNLATMDKMAGFNISTECMTHRIYFYCAIDNILNNYAACSNTGVERSGLQVTCASCWVNSGVQQAESVHWWQATCLSVSGAGLGWLRCLSPSKQVSTEKQHYL